MRETTSTAAPKRWCVTTTSAVSLGGPIIKNKMFFYYNYQQLKNPNSAFNTANEPTAAMMAGCFDPKLFGKALTLDAAHGGTPLTSGTAADIAQCTTADPSGASTDLVIPTADFDPVAKAIQSNYYLAGQQGNSVLSSNYKYLAAGNGNLAKQIGRLDYNITPKNRIDFSIIERYTPVVLSAGSPNCPVNCQNISSDGGNGQLSDVWTISANLVNEARFSFNREADYYAQASLGKGVPAKIGLKFSTADVLPTINISGTGGNSTISPNTEALFIQNSFLAADSLTWIKGKNILHFGVEVLMEQDNSTPWGGINGATLSFSGQYTTSNAAISETGYTDFLLGDVQSWNTNTTPKHYMRANNPSFYAQDDIKLRPNLTVNLGVRSETHGGSSEKYNNAGGFDPTIADPVPVAPSFILPTRTARFGSPASTGRGLKASRQRPSVMPRLGFAWDTYAELGLPRRRGAIRYTVERGYRGRSDGLRLRLRLSQLVWRCGQVRPLPAQQHLWCSYRGVGLICPFLQALQPATPFLHHPCKSPGKRRDYPVYPLPSPNSERLAVDGGRAISFARKYGRRGPICRQPIGIT
jgi:hypothetical protein